MRAQFIRDELGALAANVNRMSDELGRLYRELATSTASRLAIVCSKIVASATWQGYAGNGQLTVFSTVLIF
jgi:hypothetical protein